MAFIIYLSFRIFYYGHFAMVQNKPQNEIMFMRNCNGLKVKLLSPCCTEFFHKWKLFYQLQTQDDETRLMAHAYP